MTRFPSGVKAKPEKCLSNGPALKRGRSLSMSNTARNLLTFPRGALAIRLPSGLNSSPIVYDAWLKVRDFFPVLAS